MKRWPRFRELLVLAALLAAGCVKSVYPFYSKSDVSVDDRILGVWVEDESHSKSNVVSQLPGNKMAWVQIEEGKTNGAWTFQMFKLDGQFYLDLVPDGADMHIAAHYLARVDKLGPSLSVSFLADNWVAGQLAKNASAFPAMVGSESAGSGNHDDDTVLTGSTRQLQQLVRTAAPIPDAWATFGNYVRPDRK